MKIFGLVLLILFGFSIKSAIAQDELPVILSPYPGDRELSSYINYNMAPQANEASDGQGLHTSGKGNIYGIDTFNDITQTYYTPVDICPGDYIFAGADIVGTGGFGFAHVSNLGNGLQFKVMTWHFQSVSDLALQLASGNFSECIPAGSIIGVEGNSTTTQRLTGKVVSFQQEWGNLVPDHSHTSWGFNRPIAGTDCMYFEQNGWYWYNPACIATKWELSENNQQAVLPAPEESGEPTQPRAASAPVIVQATQYNSASKEEILRTYLVLQLLNNTFDYEYQAESVVHEATIPASNPMLMFLFFTILVLVLTGIAYAYYYL